MTAEMMLVWVKTQGWRESFSSELHFHLVVKRDKPTTHKSKSDGALAEGYSKRIGQIFPPEAQQ